MRYLNPVLYMDLSDPDVIRVGEDFYMTASSFTYVPGLPVLHSRDLVHWEIIGYAADRLPAARYTRPAHGCGIWAPSIRYHQGTFYIYACMPDEGLYAWTAKDPAGPWQCRLVKAVTGWIDPCPLFDESGAWLIHGFAASRVGINNILYIHRLSDDGLNVLDKGRRVYDGAEHGDITVEGPKIYRREGLYWILCPAGGVRTGYQLALRSRELFGPYERRVVLEQGASPVNGPHQGAWTDDGRGGDWFIHFQDVGPYGRVPHLQPVDWQDGWPVMGDHGTPVSGGETGLPACPLSVPLSDSFEFSIGPAWQWQANPDPSWSALLHPGLRLFAAPAKRLYEAGHFLSRLMTCRDFDMDVRLSVPYLGPAAAGAGIMGKAYVFAALKDGMARLVRGGAETPEREILALPYRKTELTLRLQVRDGTVSFMFGPDPDALEPLGTSFPMVPGGWTGARPGFFCTGSGGYADVRSVRITEYR